MSTVKRYIKKPVEIEAVLYDGTNHIEIEQFGNGEIGYRTTSGELVISTLEGDMLVSVGDYVIKGIKGEFYPCKPDIFKDSYNEVK